MKERIKINMNDRVFYKPTQAGVEYWETVSPRLRPQLKDDPEGYCELTLWEFCNFWGEKMNMGFSPVVETDIFVELR